MGRAHHELAARRGPEAVTTITEVSPLPDSGADRANQPGARINGHADLTTRPDFEEFLHALCRQAGGDVHLDMSEMDFIDISGVITLIRAAGSLGAGRRMVVHHPPASMRRIMDLLGPSGDSQGVVIE